MFFSCVMHVQPIGKGFHNILTNLLCMYFKPANITCLFTCLEVKYGLSIAFNSCMQAAFSLQSFAYVGVERQTNIHTCMHTYIHTYIHTCIHPHTHTQSHTFQKAILVNQVCAHSQPLAGCGCTWFDKLMICYYSKNGHHAVAITMQQR